MQLHQLKDLSAIFWFIIILFFVKYCFNLKILLYVLAIGCVVDAVFGLTRIGDYKIDLADLGIDEDEIMEKLDIPN
tara:strand:- start:311 stop:538 length:228 start_codon:yes stop_codon:yes gene_type:complete